MSSIPYVSIVIPVYNCQSTIRKALMSIRNQTYRDFEVIIVDNNCSDSTIDIITEEFADLPGLSLIKCETQGIVPALNTGLRKALGRWIARQDGDDVWHPEKLQKQMLFLKNNPNVGILGTGINIFDTNGGKQTEGTMGMPVNYPTDNNTIKNLLLYGQNPICHPSVVFTIDLLNTIGGYEQLFPLAEDLHLWCKAIPHYAFANLSERLVDYTQKCDEAYDARIPILIGDTYYGLYKTAGLVSGEREPRIYDWQKSSSSHGNKTGQGIGS